MASNQDSRFLRWHCSVCGKPDALGCKRCQLDFYCGPEHQRKDWPRHKLSCGAVAVVDGFLEATRDLPAGTRIVREVPAVISPAQSVKQGFMLCVGCCGEMGPAGDCTPQCAGCGLPRCRPDCDHDDEHNAECGELQRANFKVARDDLEWLGAPVWNGLAVLRTYLWALKKPAVEDSLVRTLNRDLTALEPLAGYWAHAKDWLLNQAGMSWLPEDKLRRAFQLVAGCSIACDTEYWALRKDGTRGIRALYVSRARTEQSCQPSLFCVGMDSCCMEQALLTTRAVRRGERLSTDHRDDPLQCAAERRLAADHLQLACSCGACVDPTRLGTHLDSLACMHCQGLVVPLPVPADAPYGPSERGGRCNGCGRESSASDMASASLTVEVELAKLERCAPPSRGPAPWEAFLRKHLRPKGPLHPTHLLALKASRRLATAMAAVLCNMGREHTQEEMRRWERTLRVLLKTLEVLRPGLSCHRNNVLIPLAQLQLLRAIHLNKDDKPLAVCRAPLVEAQAFIAELALALNFYKEGAEGLKKLRFFESLCVRLLNGASPLDFLVDGTVSQDMLDSSSDSD
ncbi:uncharacterized protein LOC117648173 [Thrips palmi]|uniref:Uncharacterized protein LOC117648173 n=1 Tax=Thrips palmi TaxID=161013 RepID=A0A6P8ZCH8_THRPL|nr:uncharacterized protein LOC117648173 [Thrips palmi]XP_034246358.1 uncharacterized protein LOC117648173 [Thrips palmi]XP_034246359.1 uncharacterized protein LOC117648173 [Thrips palmi]XP_034246360.1 uncharacterized protein LOC117648173 [Thrips palmi]XP_034246361.1 uncharacterized protein LOC117648173 [Thrips palmi]XP_034246362.1 uncharacterized protein LOC117648173 [Thrips palmi]